MTAKKKAATRRSQKSGDDEAVLVQVPAGTSPAAAKALYKRLNGAVLEDDPPMGEGERTLRERMNDLVELPRLDRTIMDPILGRVMPSAEPVKISYRAAYTFGLLTPAGTPVDAHPAIQPEKIQTEPSEGADEVDDNGHGGTGDASGKGIPAVDLAQQPYSREELEKAAEVSGLSTEQVAERHEQEIADMQRNRATYRGG